jgi:predicted AlkP superfamily pyrophosphatase or phosphodiesterase
MQRVVLLATILVFTTVLGACSEVQTQPRMGLEISPRATPEVILVSIDGYREDYLARGENPVLAKLAADGVRARWLIPSFPTVTEPNHYTLLTGLYPDQHGIVDNDIADRQIQPRDFEMAHYASMVNPRWWSDATPLWLSVQRAGMRAGEVSWPDGQVRIDGAMPDLHLNGRLAETPDQETADVLHWLDLPPEQRPRFVMLHYETVDHIGHRYGPDSPEENAALRQVDQAIGRLVDGLKQTGLYADTDLVIVSDHGMAAVAPGHQIFLDDIIHRPAVELVSLGANAGIDPRRGFAGHEAEMALLAPHPHMRCWRKHDLPPHLHYGRNPRVPGIVCIALPGWVITTHWAMDHRAYAIRGIHGYDNMAPSMRALFIAEGPSFREGIEIPPFPNVDVYSLLAHILGVRPERDAASFVQMASLLKPVGARYAARRVVVGNRRAGS